MLSHSWIRPALAALWVSSLLGCGGGSGGDSGGDSDPGSPTTALPLDTTGSLFGQVVTRGSNAPLPNATVTAGGQYVITGPDGSYLLTNLPLGQTRVTLQAAGHADDSFSADLNSSLGRQRISRELHAVGYQQGFDPARAQVLQDSGSVARLSLPANALVSASGAAPVGAVTLALTRNDPGPDSDPTTLPGDFQSAGGAVQFYGAATFTFRDASGQRMNLAAGKSATLRIPVATSPTALPATSPLYYFDDASGLWVQEGQATLRGAGANAYYEGTVTHFTTWSAAAPQDRISLTGRVVDEFGGAMAGVRVVVVGVDHNGSATATTDAGGRFSVFAKPSARIVLFAVANDGESPELALTTPAANGAVQADLVLPALSRARVTLGAAAVTSTGGDSCCNYPAVQMPFAVSGVDPARVRVLSARWELGHSFPLTCVGTPTGYDCTGSGTLATVKWVVFFNATDRGGYLATQVAGNAGELTGTLGFQASAHYRKPGASGPEPLGDGNPTITFGAVLVLDLQDGRTGQVLTLRSQPVTVAAN